MKIQSTISDSSYYNLEEHDAVSDPKSDVLVATHTSDENKRKITDTDTTNVNSPHKLFLCQIIPGAIRQIYQTIMEDVAVIGETLYTRMMVLSKEIVTDAAHIGARIFQTPREVIRTVRDSTTPGDRNTAVDAARSTSPVQICHSTTDSPSPNSNQDIINPIGPLVLNISGTLINSKLPFIDFCTSSVR